MNKDQIKHHVYLLLEFIKNEYNIEGKYSYYSNMDFIEIDFENHYLLVYYYYDLKKVEIFEYINNISVVRDFNPFLRKCKIKQIYE